MTFFHLCSFVPLLQTATAPPAGPSRPSLAIFFRGLHSLVRATAYCHSFHFVFKLSGKRGRSRIANISYIPLPTDQIACHPRGVIDATPAIYASTSGANKPTNHLRPQQNICSSPSYCINIHVHQQWPQESATRLFGSASPTPYTWTRKSPRNVQSLRMRKSTPRR